MSKSYFSGEDGHPFDSDDDGNLFGDNGREEEYDSGADLSTSPRPRDEDFGLDDEGGGIEVMHSSEHLTMCLGRGGW